MFPTLNYLDVARLHEQVFRNILRDLKQHRARRSGGAFIPDDLDPELPLDDFFARYTAGDRYGRFTIVDFAVSDRNATITFQHMACFSGGGAELTYTVHGTEVEIARPGAVVLS